MARLYQPGVPSDPNAGYALADIQATNRETVAQTQGQTQENVANIRAGNERGEGTLTRYRPNAGWAGERGGGGPQPGGQTNVADLGSPVSSFRGGEGAPAPIGVIRGMRTSYAAKGTGEGGEVEGGFLPEYASRVAAQQSSNQMARQEARGNLDFDPNSNKLTDTEKKQLADIDARYGKFTPVGEEAAAIGHERKLEELAGKPKSKAQEDEDKRLAMENAQLFGATLEQNPHFYAQPPEGKKGPAVETNPMLKPLRQKYESLVGLGRMTQEQALAGFEKEAVPILYHKFGGTPALADKYNPALGDKFLQLYGTKINPQQGALLLSSPEPSFDQQMFVVQTMHGTPNVALAKKLGLLTSGPTAPAGQVNVPGALPRPAAPPAPVNVRDLGRGSGVNIPVPTLSELGRVMSNPHVPETE